MFDLCVESAELCMEPEIRALEAGAVPEKHAAQHEAIPDRTAGTIGTARPGDKSRAQFWRKRRNEFATRKILEEHHSLLVRWSELTDKYWFKDSQESEQEFKRIANRAAQGLPKQPARKPWESWLDELRDDRRFFRVLNEGLNRYSKQGLREVLKEGLAPVVEAVVLRGVLTERDCTEFPTGSKPGVPYENVDFCYVTGEIKHVFEASAKLCQALEEMAITGRRRVNRRQRMAPQAKQKPARPQFRTDHADTPTPRPGDAALIAGKESVNFQTAEQYLGIGERQRQHLIKKGSLLVAGKGHARKITTESLREYRTPENPK